MPFTPTISDKADSAEIRTHLTTAAGELIDLQRTPADKRGDDFADEVRSRIDFMQTFDPVAKVLDDTERAAAEAEAREAAAEQAKRLAELTGRRGGPTAAGADLSERARTAGEEFVLSDGYEDFQKRNGDGHYSVEVRTLLTSNDDTADAGIWRPVGTPTLKAGTENRRRLFVRDLLSVSPTGLASVPYIQELNAVTNETGASAVAEGSAKPEVVMQFQQADAPIRKIAAWIPATTEILADAPTLRGYIDARLAYMILLREEQQVLKGTGTAPEIRGIYNTTGTQTQGATNNDVPGTVALALGKVENADGDPDGVVMNPIDYWTAIATRHSTQFDNAGSGPAPSAAAGITWGVPAVRTRALDTLECLVGAFAMGGTLFEREGVTIRVGDQHSDYFVANKVAILGEERVGLAVHRPDWFVETTLDITA